MTQSPTPSATQPQAKPAAIDALIEYIECSEYSTLPQSAIDAAKIFIFDSIGVGISGSRVERVNEVKAAANLWGQGKQAQVWVTGEWLPASSAALLNGFQIHNQEWDCVHEGAVVHPMATILSALTAYGQREGLSGKDLIHGVIVAVDVATLIGGAVTSGLKFFRPSVCGCLGATAGICTMLGIKGIELKNALGIAYSQISGTMQSHVEGSPMLAMQIGFNSQSAVMAVDMARAGFSGPHDILEGPFGYYRLFEDDYALDDFYQKLGHQYQIEQVSHKPFPTGRAAHGTVDALQSLQAEHGFSAADIESVVVYATPLINRLVGRPVKDDMDVSYAKLCNGYIGATALLSGNVTVEDFDDKCLLDKQRLSLAKKFTIRVNNCTDPNALAPISVEVALTDGRQLAIDMPAILGNPVRPMSKAMQIDKFRAACASASVAFSVEHTDKLINSIDALEQIQNINTLIKQMVSPI
ncbi:MmgE/PrpD family protein [Thalassotalea sp. Y01]|uniref:MmgE/PrpD family protein n=1 Tax=Thalassotalea sp. Y01 TaxID=2729613 RepID=UPI00145F19E4|nr:MmgE/PrpD family protein [Thalassotalea sp. Y01]NMP16956.1 MmgE/PrpD family protein [Thalassotalea sp. Y01]